MSYVNQTAIHDAFSALIETFAQANSLTVAYPGVDFEPPNDGVWLEVVMNSNGAEEYGVSDYGPAEDLGIYRVIVCGRPGAGINALLDTAESVALIARKGTEIGASRIYRQPFMKGPIEDDNVIMYTVSFWYRGTRRLDTFREFVLVGEGPGSNLVVDA